jgi:MoxR-like ATPase
MEIKQRLKKLIDQLGKGLHERDEAIKLSLLSAIAGESIFLLGPPGVGKSLIARRLKFAFDDAQSFEYLMTRFSTPEEVFGPVSIQKLKEEDKYERKTEKYMPGANLVFLDEIWKASSSIQNALLTIINEKVYRNGEQEIKVDLRGLITASNELPPSNENFGALYDRLLIRYQMLGIKDSKSFLQMITGTDPVYKDQVKPELKISNAELDQWHHEIDELEIGDEVLSVIQIVRKKIEEYNAKQTSDHHQLHVFDRRWKKIIRLLRTSAFLNGRKKVDLLDCFLMVHCLWNRPEEIEPVQEIVSETIRKHGYSLSIGLSMLKREVESFKQEVDDEISLKTMRMEEILRPVEEEYYQLEKQGEQFAGKYVSVKDYNRLKVDEYEVVNLYDDEYKLVNRLSAAKANKQFSLNIKHNSIKHLLSLVTYQQEKVQLLYKKPHALVFNFWEERFAKMEDYIKKQQHNLVENKPEAIALGKGNIFIDEKLMPVVEANHMEVSSALEALHMKLEKLRHSYQRD